MAASRQAETTSVRSSVTEEGLEEARQRLLDHIEVESVNEDPSESQACSWLQGAWQGVEWNEVKDVGRAGWRAGQGGCKCKTQHAGW